MNPTEELAARVWTMDRPTIRRLMDAGADINALGKNDFTLLMRAVCKRSMEWCRELLQWGANPHVRDPEGRTAWDRLYPSDYDIPLYSLFLQYGTDVNQYTPMGRTALHRACWYGNHALILFLLAQGADPRLPILSGYKKGQTAYDLDIQSFWDTPAGVRERLRWDTVSIQEVFIVASELGIVPIPSYLW